MSSEFPRADTDDSCPSCRDGNHRMCRRTMHWRDWQQDCACFHDKIKEHAALFHEVALEKMRASLSSDGWIVVPPNTVLEIYLVSIVSTWYSGQRYGPHLTLEGAKAAAQEKLDEFSHLLDNSTDEEKQETEEITVRTLEWNEEDDWFLTGREKHMTGRRAQFAWFSPDSAFKITREEILP